MKNSFYLAFALVIFTSCGQESQDGNGTERKDGFSKKPETKQDSLYHDVMEGHDVGMAKMGKISGYLKTVKGSLDSLKTSKNPDKTRIGLLESISADLNQADYSMNRWMEEFKPDSAENNESVRLAYLESEKDKVSRIKDRILNAVKRADSLYSR